MINTRSGLIRLIAVTLLSVLFIPHYSQAQDSKKTRFLFLLDCSGSMYGEMNKKQKIIVAKSILLRLVDSLKNVPNVEMALRSYGAHSPKEQQDCKDTRLEVDFAPHNADQIKKVLNSLQPRGTTPIAYSLTQAAGDFPNIMAKNIIILITDGIEECNGDPCAVSQGLQNKKIILKPFIVGLGMNDDYTKYFDCVGRYFDARSESDLKNILSTVVTQALNNTTIQVNLNDINGKPTETDVNMTFYNARNGLVMYNYYHTLNSLGRPDTFGIDAVFKYNLEVHTTPPVYKYGIDVKPSVHNIISLDAPQGDLELAVNTVDYTGLKCLVKKSGTDEILYVQDFNTKHKYIVGTYDLEILTLPRVHMDKIKIDEAKTSRIEIPQAGKVEVDYVKDVIASLYIMRNGKQEWVIDMNGFGTTRKEFFLLQPGSYKIIYRPKNTTNTIDTREKDFKVSSGSFQSVALD